MEFITVAVLFLLCVLYGSVPAIRYGVKYAVYFLTVMIASLFVIPFALFRPEDVRNTTVVSHFLAPILNGLLGIRWHIRNKHILQKDQACIVVANHQSGIDFLGMLNLWPIMNKCSAVAKKELRYVGPFGLAAWLCGTLFIDRSRAEAARAKLSANIEKVKQEKIKCWIFPEGTRSDSGILPFKKGAFYLAIMGGLPIIPVVYSKYYFVDHKKRTFDSGDVLINVLEPVSTEGLTKEDIPKLMEDIRSKIIEEHNRLTDEALHKPLDDIVRQLE